MYLYNEVCTLTSCNKYGYITCTVGEATPVLILRSKTSNHEKSLLEAAFAFHCRPNKTTIKELVLKTGLDEATVSTWFRYKRYRTKKRNSERTLSLIYYVH